MSPEQALQFLAQALVLKGGLSVQEAQAVVNAWYIITAAIKPKEA